jgi:hypothetical protein
LETGWAYYAAAVRGCAGSSLRRRLAGILAIRDSFRVDCREGAGDSFRVVAGTQARVPGLLESCEGKTHPLLETKSQRMGHPGRAGQARGKPRPYKAGCERLATVGCGLLLVVDLGAAYGFAV